jgi:cell division protease FtsH
MSLPLEERKLTTKAEYLDDLAMMLGGRAAEKLIFGDITAGASGDIQSATKTVRSMVAQWGMSDILGPVAYNEKDHTAVKEYSDETAKKIDDEVASIIKEALVRAEETLTKHKDALEAVAKKLLEVETLEQAEYNALIKHFGLITKTKDA